MAERSFGMEMMKRPKIKSMSYEDFNDNEYIERMVAELREGGANVLVGCLDELIGVGPQQQPLAPDVRHELLRHRVHGRRRRALRFRPVRVRSGPRLPRQADFIMVAGTITHKMAPGAQTSLRPDGRSQIRDRRGRLRHQRRAFQTVVPRGRWRGQDPARRCPHPRVPAAPRGDALRTDATPAQGEGAAVFSAA